MPSLTRRGWLAGALIAAAMTASLDSQAPGIRELSTATVTRPMLSGAEAGVPEQRGAFTFAQPYGTRGWRLTDASDCAPGVDCLSPVGYSYWPNLNNSTGSPLLYAVVTTSEGPTLFAIEKAVGGGVRKVGPLFEASHPLSRATGEGWYFSATQRTTYYVVDWTAFRRLNVETREMVTVFDIRDAFGPRSYLWQAHSSADDRVHSFTVRETETWRATGCGVYSEPLGVFRFYPRRGNFDECQIDRTGRWLLMKDQVDGRYGEDNRLIDLRLDTERILLDQNGAAGHSDNGRGTLVAWDNWSNLPVIRLWQFEKNPPGPGTIVYQHPTWVTTGLGHVAWASGVTAVGSEAAIQNGPRANEVVAFRLDGSLRCLVIAPVMTDLESGSQGGDYYSNLPKANVDPTGQYVLWTTNLGTARLDAVVARIPSW